MPAEPQTFQELRRLLREAEALKAQIRVCIHPCIYGPQIPTTVKVRVSAHPLDGPEWDVYEERFGYRQDRSCPRCGLSQARDIPGVNVAGPWRCDVPELGETR